jgi:hypothetical protein
VRKIFGRATRDGRGAGGFSGGFFLGTTGGHDRVWRETGSKRKENFYAACFGKFAFFRTISLTPEFLNPNLHFVIQKICLCHNLRDSNKGHLKFVQITKDQHIELDVDIAKPIMTI